MFDHDSLIEAMKRSWTLIAPKAMFTAAGNISLGQSENFINALDMIKWNKKTTQAIIDGYGVDSGYGFAGTSQINAYQKSGSNGAPIMDESGYFVDGWQESADKVYVPAGFDVITGDNIVYADMIPPFDVTLTFNNHKLSKVA